MTTLAGDSKLSGARALLSQLHELLQHEERELLRPDSEVLLDISNRKAELIAHLKPLDQLLSAVTASSERDALGEEIHQLAVSCAALNDANNHRVVQLTQDTRKALNRLTELCSDEPKLGYGVDGKQEATLNSAKPRVLSFLA